MSLASCVYRGTVRHARREPRANEFEYRLYMLYMDLDELPRLFEESWLWSFESFAGLVDGGIVEQQA